VGRTARERLPLSEALEQFGKVPIRALASSKQTYSNWKLRGVPWESIGPLVWEHFSHLQAASSARQGVAMPHVVTEVQGQVFQLARQYGVDSREFQVVQGLLTTLLARPGAGGRPGASARRAKAAGGER